MEKDYSEFQHDDYDRYRALRINTKYMRYDPFYNIARFSPETGSFTINVDPEYEYDQMQSLIDEFEKEEASRREIREKTPEEAEERKSTDAEQAKENEKIVRSLRKRYGDKITFASEMEPPSEKEKRPLINVLSGAKIKLGYGEGILDFLDADFDTPLTKQAKFYRTLHDLLEEQGRLAQHEPQRQKIYSHAQEAVEDFLCYDDTFCFVSDAAYRSLYTAVCPPLFYDSLDAKPYLRYRAYLLALQKEYRDILEFCYDEDFYPAILGNLMPHERYALYRVAHHLPKQMERTERAGFFRWGAPSEKPMPYGITFQAFLDRYYHTSYGTEEERNDFAARYGMDPGQLNYLIRNPHCIVIDYPFGTVAQILELELTKMLEQNVRFRKCRRCGRYFIMKGNYDPQYCERVAEGETRSCRQIAAQENYKARHADDKAVAIYNRYYKRYAARVKVRQIKEKDFNAWRYQAIVRRDECTDGKITPEELTEWMEASFPNRKPKPPKNEQEE